MSELANNKSIRKEVNDLGETLGIEPKGKTNQQKIRSIGEQASDGTYATKEYVNTLMSGALKRQIVETLPVEDIDTNTIYMVLDQSASQQGNVYNEYLYIEEAWELIGTTQVAETVVANPTLAGTEASLTGLQIGNTKYAVPQGSESSIGHTLSIKNTDSKPLLVSLCSYINNDYSITSETILNDGNFHTFNNVYAFSCLYQDGMVGFVGNTANGAFVYCNGIHTNDGELEADEGLPIYQLLTNFTSEIADQNA